MDHKNAEEIAALLNARNQLVVQYNADKILGIAENYLYEVSADGDVVACVELKRVQWYQFEVLHLTTIPAAEGKGVARKLLSRVEARAKANGCRVLQCTIRLDNERSQALFEKNGYKKVSEFYYPNSGNNVGVWQKVVSPASVMCRLYRVDKRDFDIGETIPTAGEYFDKFPARSRKIEEGLELHRPAEKWARPKCLFLFEQLAVAKKHWSKMTNGKLYEVEIAKVAILHRGDMQYLDVIADLLEAEKPTDAAYRAYWNGQMTRSPEVEILVPSAKIVSVISKSEEDRLAFQMKRIKLSP